MTDEMKLLRAFIEASGFDVEVTQDRQEYYKPCDLVYGKTKLGALPVSIQMNTDYKVTKKAQPIEKIDIYLYTYLEINKADFISARMSFYEIESSVTKNSYIDSNIDSDNNIPHLNPVIADCEGRFPKTFIEKPYRVVIYDRHGEHLFEDSYK